MYCPNCGAAESKVTHTIQKDDGNECIVVRYRRCKACGRYFKTRELYAINQPDQW